MGGLELVLVISTRLFAFFLFLFAFLWLGYLSIT